MAPHLFSASLTNHRLTRFGLYRLLQCFVDQCLITKAASLGLEMLDHRAVKKDVHALLVRLPGANGTALAKHKRAPRR